MAVKCSFCGKSSDSVERVISSPIEIEARSYICDECVAICVSILKREGMDLDTAGGLSFRMRLARKIAGLSPSIHPIDTKTKPN